MKVHAKRPLQQSSMANPPDDVEVLECYCGGDLRGHAGLPLDGDDFPSCLISRGGAPPMKMEDNPRAVAHFGWRKQSTTPRKVRR